MDKKMVVGEILLEIKELDRRLKDLEMKLDAYLAQPEDQSMAYPMPAKPTAEPVAVPEPACEKAVRVVGEPEAEKDAAPAQPKPEVKPRTQTASAPRATKDGRYIADLRKAIGLNDRFRFIHGLFGGDASLMGRTVETLDAMASFAEAQSYLDAHFSWNADDETVAYFTDMLHKRFPNG